MKNFRLWERVLIAICASAVLIFALELAVPAGEGEIYKTLIRLHVLAESDGAEDQAVKLLVRDAIVEECGDLFEDTPTTEEALTKWHPPPPAWRPSPTACWQSRAFPTPPPPSSAGRGIPLVSTTA